MFEKILIANRGEIAIRVIKTCNRLGIGTVAVYSEADARSLHVELADEKVYIGMPPASQSYLNMDHIIDAALKTKAEAIHPGYGFLSENAQFCERVNAAGLIFIGPPASAISALGDKISSKKIAGTAGVPIVPGHARAVKDATEAGEIAANIGYPVLLKPAAGGGGKGMRIVHDKNGIAAAFSSSQQETLKAFGDDKIFIEKFILCPRHIEIQILADQHGNVIYLPERECSIQRRYQKIIEESPSIAVNNALRRKMGECACDLAREAGYINAGTVEYIMDENSDFYFLEMNTRLQVEHPVTEMITGLDLVEQQIQIAAGKPLSFGQQDVSFRGWSIEARICAENPARNFLPSTGMITRYAEPTGDDLRVDSGVQAGSVIGVFYDSMLAKIISWGNDRETARENLVDALNGYHIEGVESNVYYANSILNHTAFMQGNLSTNFIAENMENPDNRFPPSTELMHHLAMSATLVYHNRQNLVRLSLKPMATHVGSDPKPKEEYQYMVKGDDDVFSLRLRRGHQPGVWRIWVNDTEYDVVTPDFEYYRRRLKLKINGQYHMFRMDFAENFLWGAYCGITRLFEIYTLKEWMLARYMPPPRKTIVTNILYSPMPGMIIDILVKQGERVFRGQELVVIESMKMESGVASPCDGKVEAIDVAVGEAVETGDVLIRFELS